MREREKDAEVCVCVCECSRNVSGGVVGEGDLAAAKKKDLFLPLKCKKKAKCGCEELVWLVHLCSMSGGG